MKKAKFLFRLFGCLLIFFTLTACNNNESTKQDSEITTPNDSDTLIIFFSRSGENYMVGDYGNGYAGYVDVGNTEVVVNYSFTVYGGSRNHWNMHPTMNFSLIDDIWIRI